MKTMWFSTSSLVLSAVMKIVGNLNNYPWGLIQEWGLIWDWGLNRSFTVVHIANLGLLPAKYNLTKED